MNKRSFINGAVILGTIILLSAFVFGVNYFAPVPKNFSSDVVLSVEAVSHGYYVVTVTYTKIDQPQPLRVLTNTSFFFYDPDRGCLVIDPVEQTKKLCDNIKPVLGGAILYQSKAGIYIFPPLEELFMGFPDEEFDTLSF